jgi:hypothetical protein
MPARIWSSDDSITKVTKLHCNEAILKFGVALIFKTLIEPIDQYFSINLTTSKHQLTFLKLSISASPWVTA